jgi:ferric-dicitrate binding protein FerR (iron transport regulator)
MGSHRKIEFSCLLDQMLSGKLTGDERNELWNYIQSSFKDRELDSLMRKHWLGLETQGTDVDEKQLLLLRGRIVSRINQAKNSSKKGHRLYFPAWKDYLMRVAAVLFVPLLLGSLFVFYRMDKRLGQMAAPMAMQQVVASPGSRAHFTLPDQTEVWLNSGSMLEFPFNLSQQAQRKVKLTGQAYFKVARDEKHPFLVETEKLIIQALGTQFDVSNYAGDQQISSTLEEGSIALLSLQGNEVARLRPGQEAVLDKVTNELAVSNVETMLTTSWKDGKLIFRNTSLANVTAQLERWFNCSIHVDSSLAKSELLYTATIQDETLGEVLKMIEISTSVQTKIEKREVYLYRKN